MLLTKRALALLLGVAVPLAASAVFPVASLAAALFFLLVVALLAVDYQLSPIKGRFELRRECESKLSLAAENPVRVVVTNRGTRAVAVSARDEFPAGFLADRWQMDGIVAPRGEETFTYHLKPLRRGDYAFGDLNLRCRGPLGLVVRQERFAAAAAVRVYPNLREIRRYELLVRRGRLIEIGLRTARLLGRGTEFERLREYQADDDFRRINWKATARRGQPISVEYQTERSQNMLIMLDAGRLMAAPIGPLAKVDYAVNTALVLAYVAARMGDNVGLVAFADRVTAHLAPQRGKRQFLAMLEALYRLPAHQTEADYDRAFRFVATHQHKRSLILLFTDLIDPEASRLLVRHLATLSRHHRAVCVTIADPTITRLAAAVPNDSRSVYQRAVAEDFLSERRRAMEELRKHGVTPLDVPADKLTASVVNHYLEVKARTGL